MRVAAVAVMILFSSVVEAGGDGLPFLHTTFYPSMQAPDAPNMDAPNAVEIAMDSRGIAADAPQLIEDGKAGNHADSTREFRATGYGVTAVLAIDASGSAKRGEFESVKSALRDLVSSIRPQDRIAVVAFADSVEVKQVFTSDKAQLLQVIGNLRAGGRFTLLNQAILNGLSLLDGDKTNARRHLLVITDGKNDGKGPDPAALESEALRLEIPVDCLIVTRLSDHFLMPLQSLAAATGGAYRRARGDDALRAAMREGIEDLLGSPVLRFRLAHIKPDGEYHLLHLAVAGGATETVRMFFPRVARPIILYVSVAIAAVLFGGGLALILYSRLTRSSPTPEAIVPKTPQASTRTKTVYSAPPPPKVARIPSAATPGNRAGQQPSSSPPSPQGTELRQIFKPPAAGNPTAWLRARGAGTRFAIDDAAVWIGAGDGNKIRLVEDAEVSWNHACIQWAAGDLYLFDNRSTNGTSVNGRRMQPGSRVRLRTGDEITIGHGAFLLEM